MEQEDKLEKPVNDGSLDKLLERAEKDKNE